MANVDWSSAPDGATHYDPKKNTWLRKKSKNWDYYRDGKWFISMILCFNRKIFDCEIGRLIKKPVTQRANKTAGNDQC